MTCATTRAPVPATAGDDEELPAATTFTGTITVTITITAVNDAPSFTSGGDVSASAAGGPQSQAWATNISDGPGESGQTLTFDATIAPADAAFFTTVPSISSDGTLSYTPSGLTGSVTVTVRLSDDGGTANGGSDTSAPQTFTITLN